MAPPARWLKAAAFAASFTCAQAQAPGDVRIALVIGNAAYAGPAMLANPGNDARAVGDTLKRLGFTVVDLRDGGQQQMKQAIAQLQAQLRGKQAIGMLYYAGHGVQVDWRNFMIPVDAKIASAADVAKSAVDVGEVIEAFRASGTRMNILVLDACRDNPFAGEASGKGLAPLDAPPGTFLAYATAPGNVAYDGDAGASNSLYTAALVQELQKPVAKIEDVFKRVRLQVRQKTGGRQIPWESTSLEDDFFFNTGRIAAAPKPDEAAREQAFNAEKADWERLGATPRLEDLYAFLQKHPSGSYTELAQTKLEALQQPQIRAQGADGKPLATWKERFRQGDRETIVFRDGLTGKELRRSVTELRDLGEDQLEVLEVEGRGGRTVLTSAGLTIEDLMGNRFDPPYTSLPGSEFKVGNRASGRTLVTRRNGKKDWLDYETRIVAREKIRTEAFGEMETYRVEVSAIGQSGERTLTTSWFDPNWGTSIRRRIETRTPGRPPEIRVREVIARSRN